MPSSIVLNTKQTRERCAICGCERILVEHGHDESNPKLALHLTHCPECGTHIVIVCDCPVCDTYNPVGREMTALRDAVYFIKNYLTYLESNTCIDPVQEDCIDCDGSEPDEMCENHRLIYDLKQFLARSVVAEIVRTMTEQHHMEAHNERNQTA